MPYITIREHMTKYEIISNSAEIQEKLLHNFRKKFVEKDPKDCWLWNGTIKTGYGSIGVPSWPNLQLYAHRVAWFMEKKCWPGPNKILCHTCNVKHCVNPHHLYEGTQKSNAQDREHQYDLKCTCTCGKWHS